MNRKPLTAALLIAGVIAGTLLSGEACAQGPSTSAALIALARQAEAGDRDARASELYRQAHEANPFDPAPLSALGQLAIRNGEAGDAVAFFRAALALERRDREARHGLGDAWIEMDEAEEALAIFDSLLAEDAGDLRAWNGKGVALDLAGRHDEAQVAYRTGLALSPDDPELLANLDASQVLAAEALAPRLGQDAVTLALNADGGAGGQLPTQPNSGRRDP